MNFNCTCCQKTTIASDLSVSCPSIEKRSCVAEKLDLTKKILFVIAEKKKNYYFKSIIMHQYMSIVSIRSPRSEVALGQFLERSYFSTGLRSKAPINPSRLVPHLCPINLFARWEKIQFFSNEKFTIHTRISL